MSELRMALRFPRSQKRVLRNVIERLESDRPEGVDIGLFRKALKSVEEDEPLIVICDEQHGPDDVRRFAAAFPFWGVVQPTVEGPFI